MAHRRVPTPQVTTPAIKAREPRYWSGLKSASASGSNALPLAKIRRSTTGSARNSISPPQAKTTADHSASDRPTRESKSISSNTSTKSLARQIRHRLALAVAECAPHELARLSIALERVDRLDLEPPDDPNARISIEALGAELAAKLFGLAGDLRQPTTCPVCAAREAADDHRAVDPTHNLTTTNDPALVSVEPTIVDQVVEPTANRSLGLSTDDISRIPLGNQLAVVNPSTPARDLHAFVTSVPVTALSGPRIR
jgi:hypothetical protein